MSQQNEPKKCNCKTPCKNCKCNRSTSTHAETVPKRYFGTYPGDMEEFVTNAIDKQSK